MLISALAGPAADPRAPSIPSVTRVAAERAERPDYEFPPGTLILGREQEDPDEDIVFDF